MSRLGLAVLCIAAGCGRVAFDGRDDAAADSVSVADAEADAAPLVCPPTLMSDEDGDGVDDSCDVCPHIADGQQDSDGDGVGNACDPQPEVPAEQIEWFDGFNSVLPEWQTNNPLVGGQMVIDSIGTPSNSIIDLGGTHWHITLGGEVVALGPTPNQFFIAGQVAGNDSYYVEVINSGATGHRRSLMRSINMMYTQLDGSTVPGSPIPVGPIRAELSNVPDQLNGVIAMPPETVLMYGPGLGTLDSFRYVLYATGMDVRLDYAIVISAR